MKTCYFSVGLNTSHAALNHQLNNYYNCKNNYKSFADQIIREYDNNGLNFLRWNGGGDLFDEAIKSIEYIGKKRPDLVLWIVSRKPDFASKIKYFKNHFIHISIDRSTIKNVGEYKKLFKHKNVFSYQVHPEEELSSEVLKDVQLVFMHDYNEVPKSLIMLRYFLSSKWCKSIVDMCQNCRRCFDGSFHLEQKID